LGFGEYAVGRDADGELTLEKIVDMPVYTALELGAGFRLVDVGGRVAQRPFGQAEKAGVPDLSFPGRGFEELAELLGAAVLEDIWIENRNPTAKPC
jgi:hypothetical protein